MKGPGHGACGVNDICQSGGILYHVNLVSCDKADRQVKDKLLLYIMKLRCSVFLGAFRILRDVPYS